MRITNKIISNNSVTNINRNKVLEDKINTQLSTGSKINRPSDDPVVAIRALRLRTNLSQVNKYYKKNVPDAESWLDITESAITTVVDIVSDFYKNHKLLSSSYPPHPVNLRDNSGYLRES